MEQILTSESDFDILRPSTLWISNRCYRVLFNNPNTSQVATESYLEDDVYQGRTYEDEASCDIDFNAAFETLSSGKIRTSFPVASSYFSYIIGSKGATKNRIENETYTQIKIPSKGQEGDIVILGKDLKTVRQARLRIETLVDQAKKKQPFTHFVSIPFNAEVIQQNFIKFKDQVLKECGTDRGIDSSLFQAPSKLHLTLCVSVLSDDRERQDAAMALEKCREFIMSKHIQGQPLKVEVKGIEYMNDDPAEVDVLYGKIHTCSWTHSLQDLTDDVVENLVKDGIAMKQHDNVKLHVTLMNTLFRSDKDGTAERSEPRKADRETFDARQILHNFKNFYFGETEVTELHLSVRYTMNSKGYYSSSTKISIAPN